MGILQAGLVSGLIGMVYMGLFYGPLPDDLGQGFFIGFWIGCPCLLFETFVFEGMLKRASSYKVFVLRFLWYQAALLLAFSLGIALFNSISLGEGFASISNRDKIVAGWIVIAMNFVIMVNRWMGRNALWIFFRGVYSEPVVEERLLLFLKIPWKDQMSSNEEFLNHHKSLQSFIEVATDPILRTSGQIYRYEPDGILVTYQTNALENVMDCLLMLGDDFPFEFQACLASDQLSIAETGDFKKDILILSKLFGACLLSLRQQKDKFLVHRDIWKIELNPLLEKSGRKPNPQFNPLGFAALSQEQFESLHSVK